MWYRKMLRWLLGDNVFLLTPVVLAVLCLASCDTGVLVVDDPNDLQPLTEEGAELVFQQFTVTPVTDAQAYKLEIASDILFTDILFSRIDYPGPQLAGSADLEADTTYYWRGAARKNWVWGYPTESRSFRMTNLLEGLSPAEGTITGATKPTLSWDAVEGAAYYEVQIADSAERVEEASPVTITAPAHSCTWPADLTDGDALHWRIKAVAADGVEGSWSEILQLTFRLYQIGETGPAGGIIYYDKGSYSDGWRYLEAAPAETEWTNKEWGGYTTYVGGTGTATGTGKANTEAIVAAYGESEPYSGLSDYAAKLCYDLEYGGYTDWFLPSKDELNLMYQNLHSEGIGGFTQGFYWSSSEYNSGHARIEYVSSGYQNYYYKLDNLRVRASRAF